MMPALPTLGAHQIQHCVLARSVNRNREYVDLVECRGAVLHFYLCDPIHAGTILATLSQEEMLDHLTHWPVRVPRWDQPRLPFGTLTDEGEAWLGRPEGAMP